MTQREADYEALTLQKLRGMEGLLKSFMSSLEELLDVEVKVNESLTISTPERVYAPSKGYIDKIIKKETELVTEGETIAEWMPVPTVPLPLEILDRYGYSSIG